MKNLERIFFVNMRKVLFITGIRSDFYNQGPIIKACYESKKIKPILIVAGAHNVNYYGKTINDIKNQGFKIDHKIDNLIFKKDNTFDRIETLSSQLSGLIKIIKKEKPDIIVSPFDREESITTAIVGVYLNIPVFHLGSGDYTKFNVDGIVRGAVDKLSHIHLCSNKNSKNKLLSMGEKKNRIFTVGSTSFDRYQNVKMLNNNQLSKKFKLDINKNIIIAIFHPVSNHIKSSMKEFKNLLWALNKFDKPTVIIKSNSDPGNKELEKLYYSYKFNKNSKVKFYKNIPEFYFVNLLRNSKLIIGNSSMGVTESAYFNLRSINIGLRQKGRSSNKNIKFINSNKQGILRSLTKFYFMKQKKFKNIYKNKNSTKNIVNLLEKIKINKKLLDKHN